MTLNTYEQFILELINRARLDPAAEAARYGIGLNDGLAAGTITTDARQVLAPNAPLEQIATNHSIWMHDTDTFSHTGAGNTSPGQRATAAGYSWTNIAENIAGRWGSNLPNEAQSALAMYDGLFLSAGHRRNTMNAVYQEVGLGMESGLYAPNGTGPQYPGWMLTEVFGRRTPDAFVTGVAYSDNDGNDFYSLGEGVGGVTLAIGPNFVTTTAAGGYSMQVAPTAAVTVTVTHAGTSRSVTLDMTGGNVKLDLVDDSTLWTSGNMTLAAGATDAGLLGIAGLSLTGNSLDNVLFGNGGDNVLTGDAGNDTLFGGDGNDAIFAGNNDDWLFGGDGDDLLQAGGGRDYLVGGAGADTLQGGNGRDTAVYSDSAGAVTINLAAGRHSGGDAQGDVLLSIEDIIGTAFNDTITGDSVSNTFHGEGGNDYLDGGAGAVRDVLYGGAGRDTLFGNEGDDILNGGGGNDLLDGADGKDILVGGTGNDVLTGGAGADVFVFQTGWGNDVITDWTAGDDRARIVTGQGAADVTLAQQGADTLLTLVPTGDTILFQNVTVAQINLAGDFIFL